MKTLFEFLYLSSFIVFGFVVQTIVAFGFWRTLEESRYAKIYLFTWTVIVASCGYWLSFVYDEPLRLLRYTDDFGRFTFAFFGFTFYDCYPFTVLVVCLAKYPCPWGREASPALTASATIPAEGVIAAADELILDLDVHTSRLMANPNRGDNWVAGAGA